MLTRKTLARLVLVVGVVGVSLTAFNSPVMAQTTHCLTNFEQQEDFTCGSRGSSVCDPFTSVGSEVLWRPAELSGSTDGLIPGETIALPVIPINYTQRVPSTGAFAGIASPCYELSLAWGDPTDATTTGARLITGGATNIPSPSLHLQGTVRFKMAVTAFKFNPVTNYFGAQVPLETPGDAAILMCMAVRETGNDVALGAEDDGSGDLEYVYLPGSEVIPAPTNGFMGEFPPGGKRFTASNEFWPPDASEFVQVEFDLGALDSSRIRGFANNGDGIDTAGDGLLDATSNGDGVNRGVLESLIFSADTANPDAEYFFIYVDEVELTSPVDDGNIEAPKVQGPIFSTDASIQVSSKFNLCDMSDVDDVELFINGVSAVGGVDVTANPVTPVNGTATFTGLSLIAGDVITATQTDTQGTGDVVSDFSNPVEVFGPGVILADNFDNYADQTELNEFWSNSINNTTPPDAKVQLTAGGGASCPNYLREANPAGANAARLYRSIGSANGSDDDPMFVTWNFKFTDSATLNGRTRFELARFDSGTFSTGARSEGSAGITMFNQIAGGLLTDYNLTLRVTDNSAVASDLTSNGWTSASEFFRAPSGVNRTIDTWHKMQIEVKSDVINYYIDDVNVNPAGYEDGVPRPNTSPYTHVIVGEGFSNNDPTMFFDNVSVTIGSNGLTHPFDAPLPDPPVIQEPIFPGDTVITLTDISTNATEVRVILDGSTTIATVSTTGFETTTIDVTIPALSFEDEITAEQTIGGESSCQSAAAIALIPTVVILDEILEPDETVVNVGGVEENVADEIRVYADTTTLIGTIVSPTTDAVAVTVPALIEGELITATQVIGGLESEHSPAVLVRPRPPLSLSVTVAIDEDGVSSDGNADFEFVGASQKIGSAPVGKALEPQTGVWQRFEFSLINDPVTVFVDNIGTPGQLDKGGLDFSIDSIFFSINSNGPVSAGPYTVYIDHTFYIDSGGQEVLIADAELANPYPLFRGQSSGILASNSSALTGETSMDGSNATKVDWEWPNEDAGNVTSVYRPNIAFPDDSLAVGFYILFNDFTTNAVSTPTLLEPNVGDIPFVRVNDVDPAATAVDLYRNGEFLTSAVPGGTSVDINVTTNSVVLDQYVARQTTPDGTSDLGFPRGITTPPAPTIVAPVFESATTVDIQDILQVANATTTQLQISRNDSVIGTVNTTGFESSSTTITGLPSLNEGDVLTVTQTANGLVSADSELAIVEGSATPCGIAFSDNFDTDTSASWNINASSADATAVFAFDYDAGGLLIPPSPNGGGSTLGLRLAANVAAPNSVEAITLSPVGQNFGGDYALRFDMWMNSVGPFPGGGAGSTEFVTAGVGYDNSTVNAAFGNGVGGWFACSGEGGSGSDYHAYKNEVLQGTGSFFAGSRNASAIYYSNIGGVDVGSLGQNTAFPTTQTGILQSGAAGFRWHEITIYRSGTKVRYVIDDLPIAEIDATVGASFPLAGNISIGYSDPFTSLATEPDLIFGLIDNLVVEGFGGGDCNANLVGDDCESIGTFDWNADGNVDNGDYAGLEDCLEGPGNSPAPSVAGCESTCLNTFDSDADNDIDLVDFAEFQEAVAP
ncbi:MAG: hypothetical protein DHS20C16_28250 [Phycisphaerae bacterium]|nr:MAG: hypothetical protein DHS20C16_28250 [Phycisphaerae bacterium]